MIKLPAFTLNPSCTVSVGPSAGCDLIEWASHLPLPGKRNPEQPASAAPKGPPA
ncbi:MAG: hypothetical protein H6645_05765 [Caldilineaceae bacterium]|nr:hypothetical protein [Caldilineaceae bacterium]